MITHRVQPSVSRHASLALLLVLLAAPASASSATRILVGPDVLVSAGEDYPHMEMMLASDPRNANRFVGGSITFSRADDSPACRTYATSDGGYTWTSATLPEMVQYGGADPQVAYSVSGTALFAGLVDKADAKGQLHSDLLVYRSLDGGATWQHPIDLGHSYDHEQIAVDRSSGKFHGRIYIGALYSPPGWKLDPKHVNLPPYLVGLFRSDDDGRSFQGPVEAARGAHNIGINVADVLVSRDGTVYAPYVEFPVDQQVMEKTTIENLWMVKSTDGGLHYSKPMKVASYYVGYYRDYMKRARQQRFDTPSFPQFTIDDSDGPYSGSIYAIWSEMRTGKPRLQITRSSDGGRTWTPARDVPSGEPAWSSQFQGAIAVNARGVVGITWFDTRDASAQDRYREYFTASTDGGRSFTAPKAVSSEPSYPRGPGDIRFTPFDVDSSEAVLGLRFGSAFQRWPNGGDYMGLAADPNGQFRALWADARSGMFQLWSAPIKAGEADQTVSTSPATVTKKMTVVFGKSSYDTATGDFVFPVRLKNISDETLYGPFTVKVTSVVDPWDIRFKRTDPINTPTIVDASNGKTGVGAVFDYSHALGDFTSLPPGAITGAVLWKLKMSSAARPYVGVEIDGYVASAH